jgi:hypothetical protein
MRDEVILQLVLVGAPILALLGAWSSLRTYARLSRRPEAKRETDALPAAAPPAPPPTEEPRA